MTVKVQKGGVGVKDGIAVRVVLIANEIVGTALVMGENGKPTEPPHSRFREDGQQTITRDDTYIPPADYRQMFKMAGAILGKKRKRAQ